MSAQLKNGVKSTKQCLSLHLNNYGLSLRVGFILTYFQGRIMKLPPYALVETWLEIVNQGTLPEYIRLNRENVLISYFDNLEAAYLYVGRTVPENLLAS